MEMQGLSDEDLVAVVSYLRTQAPVKNAVPDHQYNLLGKIVKATVLANPVSFSAPPPQQSPRGATVMNGSYLAGAVANCFSCHTPRNHNTGALEGPLNAGATGFTDPDTPDRTWSPPNLTPDPKTGRTGRMTEEQFVARMRAGRIIPGSPMPWQAYARMTDDDLRAIYRFLKSQPPVEREVGPAFVMVTKK
jgi:mono/diheme cytochrome c family protein